jgi:hypothetical protein
MEGNMRLEKLILKNFRSYSSIVEIPISNLTTLIGKNDIGKSTILEALEIYFNNDIIKIDLDDLSKGSTDDEIIISCVFSDLPNEIILDSCNETSFDKEYLLNDEKKLEIRKVYKMTSTKPKESIFINCMHPSLEKYSDLLLLKNSDLKKRAKELGINEDLYSASVNAEIRNAIWCNKSKEELRLQETNIPVDKEGVKDIYSQIQKYLPIFALFQSDRPSRDDDKEVTNPLNIAIKQALKEVQDQIDTIKNQVKGYACETATRTLNKLKEMDKEIAESLVPEFKSEPKFDSLFKLTIKSDDDIPINKRGSGVRRLILLNFFRAEAERTLNENNKDSIIYAFEEPETSQHPDYQLLLLDAFKSLVINPNCQVLFTTHTPALASRAPLDGLRFIHDEEGIKKIDSNNETMFDNICKELGILPDVVPMGVKGVVLVEGKDDVIFLQHIAKCLKEGDFINSTFAEAQIAIIPIAGCDNLKYWVHKKLVEQFNLPWGILLDSDNGAEHPTKNQDVVQRLKAQGIKAFTTRKREIENYIDTECIGDYRGPQISATDDAKKLIEANSSIKGKKVIETKWCLMSCQQIREAEKYQDNDGNIRYEFTEMIQEFLDMCN